MIYVVRERKYLETMQGGNFESVFDEASKIRLVAYSSLVRSTCKRDNSFKIRSFALEF